MDFSHTTLYVQNDLVHEDLLLFEPTIRHFQDFYKTKNITVVGLLIGTRGPIPKSVVTALEELGLGKRHLDLALISLNWSKQIVKNNHYNLFY